MINMKILIIALFTITMLTSCASSKKVYKKIESDNEFKPYIENWKLNNPLAGISLKGVQTEIPMKFNNRYPFVGVCVLNKDVNERVIYVNPLSWKQSPAKRERYVNHLLNLCYNENPNTSYYYEIPYYGF